VAAEPSLTTKQPGWIWIAGVPEVLQPGNKDCGAAALSAVLAYWGRSVAPQQIRKDLHLAEGKGLLASELLAYARTHGFDAYAFQGQWADVLSELRDGRPLIVGVAKRYGKELLSHYEVVVGVQPVTEWVLTLDPAHGWRQNEWSGFMKEWEPTGRVIIVLFPAAAGASEVHRPLSPKG